MDATEKLMWNMMKMTVRTSLYDLLKLFRPDIYKLLDPSYKYELLDKEMPLFMFKEVLEMENATCLMVKGKYKTGKMCRFLFILAYIGESNFQCAVDFVPDNARPMNLPKNMN